MAQLDTKQMHEILSLALPTGERLQYCAYGVRQPNMLLMVPAFALAIVPGVILTHKLTRHYVVGMSRNYLIIAEISPKWRSMSLAVDAVKTCDAISLNALRGVEKRVKTGMIFTRIRFGTGRGRFEAKFHRAFSKSNAADAAAMAEIIGGLQDRRTRMRG